MLKIFRGLTLISLIIIISISLSGCSWRRFKQWIGWCQKNCNDIPGSIEPPIRPIPPKPLPTFPTPKPTFPQRPHIDINHPSPSHQSRELTRLVIELAARQAALEYWQQKNGQVTFDELYQVASAEVERKTMERGGVVIVGGGGTLIAYKAANYVWEQKTRRG